LETTLIERIVAVLRDAWRRLDALPGGRAMAIATYGCVALGLWLRARGFLYEAPSFWLDECLWAIYLVEEPLSELIIRPIGFMAISKVIAAFFGPTETVLRTMPWLAGVVAALAAPGLARRLFSSAGAQLLFVAIITLHPSATSFAKEFKPYSISLTLHLMLALLTLCYLEERRGATLAWLLGTAALGTLFAQDLLFAYPGVFLLAGWAARRTSRQHLVAVVAASVVVIGVLLTQYALIWRVHSPSGDSQAWGQKYDTFFVEGTGSYLDWFLHRYQGLAAFAGNNARWNRPWLSKEEWESLRPVANAVWLVVHLIGLVALVRLRRWTASLLLVLPPFTAWIFNAFGFWPFGMFRANLFMLVYLAGIAAMAFERKAPKPSLLELVPASILVLIPLLVLEQGWGPTKRGMTYTSRIADAVEFFAKRAPKRGKPKQIIILGRGYCEPWRYYLEFHPEVSRFKKRIERGYEARCIHQNFEIADALLAAAKSSTAPTWLVRGESTDVGSVKGLSVVQRFDFGRDVVVAYVR
jgi:hypothetical protein